MGKSYYDEYDESYPPVIVAVLEGLRYYYATLLYGDEDYSTSRKRFFFSSEDRVLQDASKVFQLSNVSFPFTFFNFEGFDEDLTRYNTLANSGNVISSEIDAAVTTRPMLLTLRVSTFYTEGYDFFRAVTLLTKMKSWKIKINVPIVMNGVSTTIPVRLYIEGIGKGQYAWDPLKQLTTGRIQDIDHNTVASYFDFVLDSDVSPVETLEAFIDLFVANNGTMYPGTAGESQYIMPTDPEIVSTTPYDHDSGVPVNSRILVHFNTDMNEESVENNIYCSPFTSLNFEWVSGSTAVYLEPIFDLQSGSTYTVQILNGAKSCYFIPLIEDYEFTFDTKVHV